VDSTHTTGFTVEQCRRFFAEEIRVVAGLSAPALVEAFAAVPRERFLGPPPWRYSAGASLKGPSYRTTSDPRDIYHDVFVALRSELQLNNGQPSLIARLVAALDLDAGKRVFHLGCGTGYYTAIMAHAVGPQGRVTAVEIDAELAALARANLEPYANVTVLAGDGAQVVPGPCDAILINAGVTHARPEWLAALRDGGVLVLPLRVGRAPGSHDAFVLRAVWQGGRFAAEPVAILTIYPGAGLCDPATQAELNRCFESHDILRVKSLRIDVHERAASCVAHAPGFCLSAAEAA